MHVDLQIFNTGLKLASSSNMVNAHIPWEQRPSFNKIMKYKPVPKYHCYLIINEEGAKKVDDDMKAGPNFPGPWASSVRQEGVKNKRETFPLGSNWNTN